MSARTKSKKQGSKRQKAAADAEERAPSLTPLPPAASPGCTRSPTPPPEAAAVDEVLEVVSGPSHAGDASDTLSTVGKGKGRGKKNKEKATDQQLERKPRMNFTLSPEQEDVVFEWLEENELMWRRGHRLIRTRTGRRPCGKRKGGSWTCPLNICRAGGGGCIPQVKLHKVKSGQAAKKLTDREKYVLQKCSFYGRELRHRSFAPMKPLPRDVDPDATEAASEAGSEVESVLPVEADREEKVETEGLLSNIEKTAAQASKGAVYSRGGTSRSTKRRRHDAEEEECLREIQDNMKANTQLVGEKSSSLREPFITYVSVTLRRLPDHQYDAMMRKITSLLQTLMLSRDRISKFQSDLKEENYRQKFVSATDFSSSADLPSILPATPRPRQSQSAPPQGLYQSHPQYQQPQRPAYPQYQLTQQFQQPQPPAIPQYQSAQSKQTSTSGTTDQPRRSADT